MGKGKVWENGEREGSEGKGKGCSQPETEVWLRHTLCLSIVAQSIYKLSRPSLIGPWSKTTAAAILAPVDEMMDC